jgi:Hemerythrin HHE cation binding domain
MLLAHDHSELDAALADVFAALAAGEVEKSFRNLDLFWARLAVHIRAENIELFPTLLAASKRPLTPGVPARGTVQEIITRLRADHDFFMSELAAIMKQLRELLRRGDREDSALVPAKVLKRMEHVSRRLEKHNALEESQVYHWAGAVLDVSEQKALNERLRRELENLPVRFQAASSGTT